MEKNASKVLVLGATGLVGSHVLSLSEKEIAFPQMVAWVRNIPANPPSHIQFQKTTWEEIQSGKTPFPNGITTVICCLGTTIKKAGSQEKFREIDYEYPIAVANLAKSKGVKNFLIVTALGSDQDSIVFYNRVKGEVEKDLVGLKFPYLGVFRPSLLLGERGEFRPGEKLAEFLTSILPFSWFGLQKFAPILGETVARAMLKKATELEKTEEAMKGVVRVEYLESDQIQELGKK